MAARIINASHGHYVGELILEFDIDRASGETSTGFSFAAGDVIHDVFVVISTAESTASTKTIDIGGDGTSGENDPDGLVDGLSTAAAGTIRPAPTITTGSNEVYFASTTEGVLQASLTAGADVAGDVGTYWRNPGYVVAAAMPLTYTLGSAHTELVAKGYVRFFRKP